jgi:fructokinase
MNGRTFCIVGLGEMLWDLFPAGKQLGGAPSNFAYCTSLLGDRGVAASRVGRDGLGNEALQRLTRLGLETSYIQTDETHATGTVSVRVDEKGEPAYEITNPVAWDFLRWDSTLQSLAQEADAVCFGTLAQRAPSSRETIRTFLATVRPGTARVFDVNLRQSFYSEEVLAKSMELTDILKLNHEELPRVAEILGLDSDLSERSCTRQFIERFGLRLLCVTRGDRGSLLVSASELHEHAGFKIRVVDTVGAGDAFTAALVYHFLRGSSLASMNEAANRMGAWVASREGATPGADHREIAQVRDPKI